MSACIVCDRELNSYEGHTFHTETCSALHSGDMDLCECGGFDECCEGCCPTCNPAVGA